MDEVRIKYIKGKPSELMENQIIASIGSQNAFEKFWKFKKNYFLKNNFSNYNIFL